MADDIPKYFSTASGAPIEPDVLAELESIARLHALSAEDMFYKWDSYCIRREVDATELTLAMVRAFKQDLQDTLEKSSRAAQALARGGGGGGGGGGGSAAARAGMRASGGGDVFGM
jgi:DNA polymerase alpha subunit B